MPALDIDRDAAHEAAQRELSKPIYPRPSLTDRILNWLNDVLSDLVRNGSQVPGGWFTLLVLGLLVAAAAMVALRVARRTMGSARDRRLYDSQVLTAADHRTAAERAAAQGDWNHAIRQRLRAIARQLEQDGLLTAVPGRTAGELAHDAGLLLPGLSGEFTTAARIFDDVTYGGQPGTEQHYRLLAALDDSLRRDAAPAVGPAAEPAGQQWAAVR